MAIATAGVMTACCNHDKSESCSADNGRPDGLATIMQRKSVRAFAPDTIPSEVMTNILKAAMAAPTGRNIQPWRFVVLTDTSRYDEVFVGNHNMAIYKGSAAVVVLCADTTFVAPPRNQPNAAPVSSPNALWRDDMGACTENLLLAVEYYGYGAVWTACYPFTDRMTSVHASLGLPATVVPYSVVAIGRPAGNDSPKDKWKPENVHYDRW